MGHSIFCRFGQCSLIMTDSSDPSNALDPRLEKLAERALMQRRGKAVRPVGRKVDRALFRKAVPGLTQGATVSALEERWPEIVGQRLAELSRPVSIVREKLGRALIVEAPSAAAGLLQHQAGVIIERVRLGGGGEIRALRIRQTKTLKPVEDRAAPPAFRPLTGEERAELESGVESVESEALRRVLVRLGEAILTRR